MFDKTDKSVDRERLDKARGVLEHMCASMGIDTYREDARGAQAIDQWDELMSAIGRGMGHDGWVCVIGMPNLGWAAVYEAGIDMNRCLVIDDVGDKATKVISLLTEICSVIVLGPDIILNPHQQRILHAKAHKNNVLLLSTTYWNNRKSKVG